MPCLIPCQITILEIVLKFCHVLRKNNQKISNSKYKYGKLFQTFFLIDGFQN